MNALVSFPPSCRSDRVSGRHTLICRGIVQETHDVKTFVFCPKRGQAGQFKAGQFITLNLVIDGAPAVRTYSISSPPTRVGDLRITVKRVPGGLASNWLHDNLEQGSEIEIDGPSGSFNWDDLRSDRPLFLSGGSGIRGDRRLRKKYCQSIVTRQRFTHNNACMSRRDSRPPGGCRDDDGFHETALAFDCSSSYVACDLDPSLIGPGALGKTCRQDSNVGFGCGHRLVLGVIVVQPLAGIETEKPDLRLADTRFR